MRGFDQAFTSKQLCVHSLGWADGGVQKYGVQTESDYLCVWMHFTILPLLFLLPHSEGLRTRRLWVQWDQCRQSLLASTTGPPGRQTASGFEVWVMSIYWNPGAECLVTYTEVLSSS